MIREYAVGHNPHQKQIKLIPRRSKIDFPLNENNLLYKYSTKNMFVKKNPILV